MRWDSRPGCCGVRRATGTPWKRRRRELLVWLASLGQRLAYPPCGPASGVAFREAGGKSGRDGQRIAPRGVVWLVREVTLLASVQVGCWLLRLPCGW